VSCLKTILKFTSKFTSKQLGHVSVQLHHHHSSLFMLTAVTVVKLSRPNRRYYIDISYSVCSMQYYTKLLLICPRPNHAHAPLLLTKLSSTDTTHFTPFHRNFKFLAISICRTFRSMLHVTCISHTWLRSFVITINVSTCSTQYTSHFAVLRCT
jgi:hypothetical protein